MDTKIRHLVSQSGTFFFWWNYSHYQRRAMSAANERSAADPLPIVGAVNHPSEDQLVWVAFEGSAVIVYLDSTLLLTQEIPEKDAKITCQELQELAKRFDAIEGTYEPAYRGLRNYL